jgi:hypothetical protein
MQFELTIQAAPVAGSGISTAVYDAETQEAAIAAFWEDVDAFGLCVSKVVSVRAL